MKPTRTFGARLRINKKTGDKINTTGDLDEASSKSVLSGFFQRVCCAAGGNDARAPTSRKRTKLLLSLTGALFRVRGLTNSESESIYPEFSVSEQPMRVGSVDSE